jgi:L-fuconolactonase
VSTLAATYEQVVDVAGRLTAHLSADEQAEFWAGTATRFYRLTT